MILVKENKLKKGFKTKKNEVYVNTLMPNFEFKNNKGEIIKPLKNNISL